MRGFLRRNVLWLCFMAVLVPLVVLLGLEYGWLAELQRKSAVAERAFLQNYLASVASRVEYHYRSRAERILNMPAALLDKESPWKTGRHFAKKATDDARTLFVVNFSRDWGGVRFFDPDAMDFFEPDQEVSRAVGVAIAPWRAASAKGMPLSAPGLAVDERDPRHRIILNPVTDDAARVLGIAGMIIDEKHFQNEVLLVAIGEALPQCEEAIRQGTPLAERQDDFQLAVLDGADRVVVGSLPGESRNEQTEAGLSFVFTDWSLQLSRRDMTAEEWAQSNFVLNVSLTTLLAIALLGGIVFTIRTASREMKLSRMKSDFVSNVSHELRTPLASIRVFGEFLRLGRARTDAKAREYGEFIETESRRLTQLVNNILDFSKIESGAKTYEMQPTRIDDVVEETLRTLAVGLKHKGFRLDYRGPASPMPRTALDGDAIAQALANLVDNAVKYSGGSAAVEVTLTRAGDEARIAVTDRGIGISRDEQTKIFERFHRVSTGLIHDVKGSGLGLAIVAHIAEAHGGHVEVDSEPGRGSTFTIHLPLAVESGEPAERPAGAPFQAVEEA